MQTDSFFTEWSFQYESSVYTEVLYEHYFRSNKLTNRTIVNYVNSLENNPHFIFVHSVKGTAMSRKL